MQGFYLCGCDPENERIRRYSFSFDPKTGEATWKRYDRYGYEVCPIHGMRLHGFAGVKAQGPQGNEVIDWHAEFVAVYGPTPKNISLGTDGFEDRRDNRDPAAVGNAFLNEKKKTTNGKGTIIEERMRPPMVIDE